VPRDEIACDRDRRVTRVGDGEEQLPGEPGERGEALEVLREPGVEAAERLQDRDSKRGSRSLTC
jgi:hypothetical protein